MSFLFGIAATAALFLYVFGYRATVAAFQVKIASFQSH